MIDNDRLGIYLSSIEKDNGEVLSEIEKEALDTFVPIIRKDMQYFLRTILAMIRPKNILEIGSGVGFSAILMAENTESDCMITTIENYEPRFEVAKNNFKKAKVESRITFLEGDAEDILTTLSGKYDFVFVDAAKGQYINYWPEVKRLTEPGAVIVTDNVLQDGDILESHFVVERRNRTIYKRIREYLYELCHDENYETTILSVGDGVALTSKKGDTHETS